jgi:hypothetical protein
MTYHECETNALSIEIRFIHISVEAGMAAVRIGVLDWLLVPWCNEKCTVWQACITPL